MKKFFKSTNLFWAYLISVLISMAFQFFEVISASNKILFYIIFSVFGVLVVTFSGIKESKIGLAILEVCLIICAVVQMTYSGKVFAVNVVSTIGNYISYGELYTPARTVIFLLLSIIYPAFIVLVGNAFYKKTKP